MKVIRSSGAGMLTGGGTWSAKPPCSSKLIMIKLHFLSRLSLITVLSQVGRHISPLRPVFRVPDSVVQVSDQLLPSSCVAERVHRVDGAAFGVVVGELGEGAVCDVRVEFGRVDDFRHGVVLDPLVGNVSIIYVSVECWSLPCTFLHR